MIHPHQLHAMAALHSLRAAMPRLAEQAHREAADIAAAALEPADGLHPPTWGTRRAHGGHGDPAAGAALSAVDPTPVRRPWAILASNTASTLQWLADQMHAPAGADQLDRIQAAVAGLHPNSCATLTRWLEEADQRIRRALGLPPDQWPLPGSQPCPACGVRLLRVQTSPPDTATWTITCGAGCACAGDGCPCGMPVRPAGVRHIWAADSPLATSAFADRKAEA